MNIKQYKDYDGNKVEIGDEVDSINPGTGNSDRNMGKVIALKKQGFYVWVRTERLPNRDIWGKFTRKVKV